MKNQPSATGTNQNSQQAKEKRSNSMKLQQKPRPYQKWAKTAILALLIFTLFALPIAGLYAETTAYSPHTATSYAAPPSSVSVSFSAQPALDPMPLNSTIPVNLNGNIYRFVNFPNSWLRVPGEGGRTSNFEFTVNGTTSRAFCLEPIVPTPPTGNFTGAVLSDVNSELSRALYWLDGPGASTFWTEERLSRIPVPTVTGGGGTLPQIDSMQMSSEKIKNLRLLCKHLMNDCQSFY